MLALFETFVCVNYWHSLLREFEVNKIDNGFRSFSLKGSDNWSINQNSNLYWEIKRMIFTHVKHQMWQWSKHWYSFANLLIWSQNSSPSLSLDLEVWSHVSWVNYSPSHLLWFLASFNWAGAGIWRLVKQSDFRFRI